jgi:hypothetical protein
MSRVRFIVLVHDCTHTFVEISCIIMNPPVLICGCLCKHLFFLKKIHPSGYINHIEEATLKTGKVLSTRGDSFSSRVILLSHKQRHRLCKAKRRTTKEPNKTPSIVFLPDPSRDGLHIWVCPIEDHVLAMPPDAPEDQNNGGPQVSLRRSRTRPGGPPLKKQLSVSRWKPSNLIPLVKSPCPHLPGHHTTKQKVLDRLGLLITQWICRRPRQPPALQPIRCPAAVPRDEPHEQLTAVWIPRSPNLRNSGGSWAPDEGSISRLRRIHPISQPCPLKGILAIRHQANHGKHLPQGKEFGKRRLTQVGPIVPKPQTRETLLDRPLTERRPTTGHART